MSHRIELVIVSGASTGMGAGTARALAARGFHVLAGVRTESDGEAIRAEGIEPAILDVTTPGHIEDLVARVQGDPEGRRLVALVNNAGIPMFGPVETLPLEAWRRAFEVNLFGHVAMIQAFLPFLLESRGRIVNISSVGGRVSIAAYGAYAGSKHAMEAMSDSLRRELAPQGVQVVVVQPGAVDTSMAARGTQSTAGHATGLTSSQRERYGDLLAAVLAQANTSTKGGVSSDRAGEIIADSVTSSRPRARRTIGRDAAVVVRLAKALPDGIMDLLVAANLRRTWPGPATAASGGR